MIDLTMELETGDVVVSRNDCYAYDVYKRRDGTYDLLARSGYIGWLDVYLDLTYMRMNFQKLSPEEVANHWTTRYRKAPGGDEPKPYSGLLVQFLRKIFS